MHISLCQEENVLFFIYFHIINFETFSLIKFSLHFNTCGTEEFLHSAFRQLALA